MGRGRGQLADPRVCPDAWSSAGTHSSRRLPRTFDSFPDGPVYLAWPRLGWELVLWSKVGAISSFMEKLGVVDLDRRIKAATFTTDTSLLPCRCLTSPRSRVVPRRRRGAEAAAGDGASASRLLTRREPDEPSHKGHAAVDHPSW